MTNVAVPLRESSSAIIRPIVKTVIEQILFITEAEHVKNIIYTQRSNKSKQKQTNELHEPLRLETNELIKVEYSVTPNVTVADNGRYLRDYLPIYTNKKLGITLTPMHAHMVIEMNVTYRSQSYDELLIWLTNYARATLRISASAHHNILYNITRPDAVYNYLYDVWGLTETVAPYGNTFGEFLTEGFVTGLSLRSNKSETAEKLILAVKNTSCLGMYTQLPPDVPTTQGEPPFSEITFTYTLNFEQPTAILLRFQKIIHNRLVDIKHLYKYADRNLHDDPMRGQQTLSGVVYDKIKNQQNVVTFPERSVNESDGWQPEIVYPGHKIYLHVPIRLDLDDLHSVITFSEIVNMGFPDWMLPLVMSDIVAPVTPSKWFYLFTLYEVNETENLVPVYIDVASGEIKSMIALDPRSRHYLCIYKNFKLGTVDLSVLRKDPVLLTQIFNQYIAGTQFVTIGNGSYVVSDSLLKQVNNVLDLLQQPGANPSYKPYKVLRDGTFTSTVVRNQH
jgi:hypothetical protein